MWPSDEWIKNEVEMTFYHGFTPLAASKYRRAVDNLRNEGVASFVTICTCCELTVAITNTDKGVCGSCTQRIQEEREAEQRRLLEHVLPSSHCERN